ncbi:MAG: sigma-54 dependent transcriptional regulator [Syntrophorhabdus sp.]|jgi:two-component system NtrC family response regulator|nr:sigma-54-dependent Fis family transcriptional regulator [Syntrophorhabdus sp.]MBP8744330.1 sigma-54-dependent Fis family transcriptional regulator [Syntrophorhabdus sp.]HOD78786.1 sigma-54 dependent transcriptional regulator [Syntrophorhabdus sp.]HQH81904.1 sigma-54 dependent transcriptional regulator [Syntrophorhabdus sp.]HQM24914.1 sigma-54 dependent transcriptional regulator [Syntrophorhabdus sp.]
MERATILIVEDEETQRSLLSGLLQKEGYTVEEAGNGANAIDLFRTKTIDLVLLDFKLPDMDGLAILKGVKEINPEVEIIMITAYGSIENAVNALKAGASEYLTKPIDLDDLLFKIKKIENKKHLVHENRVLKEALKDRLKSEDFIYTSEKMGEVVSLITRIAKTDSTCIIEGESGVGKEVVFNLVHQLSSRRNQPLVKVNCAAIPETLLESELFGYEKGAFTGAFQRKIGKFELANKGTVFLDEIGDLTPLLQAKLLRVIQEKELERLGGLHPVKIDVRLIVATNRNLEEEVKKGNFREDLYYRLNVVKIVVPPLRERKEDIPLLMDFFVKKYATRYKKNIAGFTRESRDQLIKYDYPGNVRELENMIERAIVLARGDHITLEDIPHLSESNIVQAEGGIKETVGVVEKQMIMEALIKADWVQTRAAGFLGISERMLRYKMKKYAITRE